MSSHHPPDACPLLTRDGDPIATGMAVRNGRRGTGVVLRVLADGVVIRWDSDIPEPARTTIVEPDEISRIEPAQARRSPTSVPPPPPSPPSA